MVLVVLQYLILCFDPQGHPSTDYRLGRDLQLTGELIAEVEPGKRPTTLILFGENALDSEQPPIGWRVWRRLGRASESCAPRAY